MQTSFYISSYFHPDHLGSSTLITDNFGDPYQFFLNLPFGETMAEQRRSGSFNNPYKFNDYGGKSFKKAFDEHTARSAELDEEIEERDSPMPLKTNNKFKMVIVQLK